MKKILIILLVIVASCTGQQTAEQKENGVQNKHTDSVAAIPSNNGQKWKADEATMKNVAAIEQVVNDPAYANPSGRRQLYVSVKERIDTLVKQCRMKGAEHDALHAWLETVLKNVGELNEDEDDFFKARAALKKNVKDFYQSFE
jgi:hypothetical protein